ncbi:helix-turn-helix domain-containing protein [Planosporangium sp. 12N6]|uniref:helix-turn-helix domain-containing protein n=1 Tax=Planosporangium spinosum TaxID=3402278 RepID=UPI003CE9C346
MYRERPALLPGAVVWTSTVPAAGATHRVLPDGCLDVIWVDGELLVAGPDTGAYVTTSAPGTRYIGLRFAPGTGPTILGTPAHLLRDSRVPLAQLWPADRVRQLADEVAAQPRTLEVAAVRRWRDAGPSDRAVAVIVARLRAGTPVAVTAQAVGLSERQLHRRCLDAFGYGPKTLARVLRLRRALALARAGTPFAAVAATAGYADQAHLSREVKALAGVSLTELLTT